MPQPQGTMTLTSPRCLRMSSWKSRWSPSRRLGTWSPASSVRAPVVWESTSLTRRSIKTTLSRPSYIPGEGGRPTVLSLRYIVHKSWCDMHSHRGIQSTHWHIQPFVYTINVGNSQSELMWITWSKSWLAAMWNNDMNQLKFCVQHKYLNCLLL